MYINSADIKYEIYTNSSSGFCMKLTHMPTKLYVDNKEINNKSRYKTKALLLIK